MIWLSLQRGLQHSHIFVPIVATEFMKQPWENEHKILNDALHVLAINLVYFSYKD